MSKFGYNSIIDNILSWKPKRIEKAWELVVDQLKAMGVSAAQAQEVAYQPSQPRTALELFRRLCLRFQLEVPTSPDFPTRNTLQEAWIAAVFARDTEKEEKLGWEHYTPLSRSVKPPKSPPDRFESNW